MAPVHEVSAEDLSVDEYALRRYFRARRTELRRKHGAENIAHATRRIRELVSDALTAAGVARWSDAQRVVFKDASEVRRPLATPLWSPNQVGPAPPSRPANGRLWLDTSGGKRTLRIYDREVKEWRVVGENVPHLVDALSWMNDLSRPRSVDLRWDLPSSLNAFVARLLSPSFGRDRRREEKSGRPAYLACASLAALLAETPTKIADVVANHRRSRFRRSVPR